MNNKTFGMVAAGISAIILSGWAVFWTLQVMSAIDLIQLANAPM